MTCRCATSRARADADDLRSLRRCNALRESRLTGSLDYWKSIPYFASFMEGYRPGERAGRNSKVARRLRS